MLVALSGCSMIVLYMPAVVIHAVFPNTEADHDFATEELGEDQ